LHQVRRQRIKEILFFKDGHYQRAIKKYLNALKLFKHTDGFDGDLKTKAIDLKVTCHSNIATAYMKLKDYSPVWENVSEALKINPNHVKCLFHRGVLHERRNEVEQAIGDFKKVLSLEPSNADASKHLQRTQSIVQKLKEKERKVFGGFFNKVKLVDEKEEQERAAAKEREKKRTKTDDAMSSDDDDKTAEKKPEGGDESTKKEDPTTAPTATPTTTTTPAETTTSTTTEEPKKKEDDVVMKDDEAKKPEEKKT